MDELELVQDRDTLSSIEWSTTMVKVVMIVVIDDVIVVVVIVVVIRNVHNNASMNQFKKAWFWNNGGNL